MRLFLLFCLLPLALNAQLYDDFQDNNLNENPEWKGMLNAFQISSGKLQSNYQLTNASFYISHELKPDSGMMWLIDVFMNFNPSSANYIDYVLFSDSLNLNQMKNGLFVRCGNSSDEISLYRLSNGIETKLIDGKDAALNQSVNTFKLKVILNTDTLFLEHLNAKDSVLEQSKSVVLVSESWSYTGIKIRQSTASFFNKHFFDHVYAGPLLRDTTPPVLDSIWYDSPNTLSCSFNEQIDSLSIQNIRVLINGVVSGIYNPKWMPKTFVFSVNNLLPNTLHQVCLEGVRDKAGNSMPLSCKTIFSLQTEQALKEDIVINELMADPDPPLGLANKEYVELFNRSGKYLDVSGFKICDQSSCKTLNERVLFPDSFILIYNVPALNNSGESIYLLNSDSQVIHAVSYDLNTYRNILKSSGGYSLEMIDPYRLCKGMDNWTASEHPSGGTPGKINSVRRNFPADTIAPFIVSYEILPPDRILLNLSEEYDSLSLNHLIILSNGQPLGFDVLSVQSRLARLDIRLHKGQDVLQPVQLEFSGFKDCEGNIRYGQKLSVNWLNMPRPKDLIINEVLFNPKTGGVDFIELYNRSDYFFNLNSVFMVDLDHQTVKDMFALIDTYFIMPPKHYLLLTSDTGIVCRDYTCGNFNALKIQMRKMPSMPDEGVSFCLVNTLLETLDSLVCSSDWHFSLIKDKNGVSLERLNSEWPTLQSSNWHSASYTKGYATPAYKNSQHQNTMEQSNYFSANSLTLSPDGNAIDDFILFKYQLPSANYLCTLKIFNQKGELIAEPYNNRSIGTDGQLIWDGTSLNGELCPEGHYLITIICNSPTDESIRSFYTAFLTYGSVQR